MVGVRGLDWMGFGGLLWIYHLNVLALPAASGCPCFASVHNSTLISVFLWPLWSL